jgi:putative hemolysin
MSQPILKQEGAFEDKASPDFEIRNGSLVVRLARDADEINASMALRYKIFYEEMAARATAEMAARKQDFDRYDEVADHLLVLDEELGSGPESVVGTYRLIRRAQAARCGAFYSADEYDVSKLIVLPDEILELGRSCVDAAYRDRRVINLLWQGIASYLVHYDISLLFGCASLPGRDFEVLKYPLSYLYHNHMAPAEIRPRALAHRYVDMNIVQPELVGGRQGLKTVPPLIKGYLRLGGFIGDGAVIDEQFNTTDVCVVVQTSAITDKYAKHYERRGTKLRAV